MYLLARFTGVVLLRGAVEGHCSPPSITKGILHHHPSLDDGGDLLLDYSIQNDN